MYRIHKLTPSWITASVIDGNPVSCLDFSIEDGLFLYHFNRWDWTPATLFTTPRSTVTIRTKWAHGNPFKPFSKIVLPHF